MSAGLLEATTGLMRRKLAAAKAATPIDTAQRALDEANAALAAEQARQNASVKAAESVYDQEPSDSNGRALNARPGASPPAQVPAVGCARFDHTSRGSLIL